MRAEPGWARIKLTLNRTWFVLGASELAVGTFSGEGSMNTLMLVGAVFASLALGVLVAYGICQAMFRVFRIHAMSAAKVRGQAAGVTVMREG
jgi:hypothetical protein